MFEKDNIGDLSFLDDSSIVSSSSSSLASGSSEPFISGFFGSKNPDGFFKLATSSKFSIASSAVYKPADKPALGSLDKSVSNKFIRSISTP